MRFVRSMMGALALLAVAACDVGTTGPPLSPGNAAGPVSPTVDKVVLEGTRALVLAELAYNSAAEAALAGIRAGKIRGTTAQRVRELNQTATRALEVARTTQSFSVRAAKVAEATEAIFGLRSLTPAR